MDNDGRSVDGGNSQSWRRGKQGYNKGCSGCAGGKIEFRSGGLGQRAMLARREEGVEIELGD